MNLNVFVVWFICLDGFIQIKLSHITIFIVEHFMLFFYHLLALHALHVIELSVLVGPWHAQVKRTRPAGYCYISYRRHT